MLDVRVMVDGVIEFEGEVGKTKSVWEGVGASCWISLDIGGLSVSRSTVLLA
jgi:hypothetical protein